MNNPGKLNEIIEKHVEHMEQLRAPLETKLEWRWSQYPDLREKVLKELRRLKKNISKDDIVNIYNEIRSFTKNIPEFENSDEDMPASIDAQLFLVPFVDLRGIDLSKENLSNLLFIGMHLERANFGGAILVGTSFSESYIEYSNFSHAILRSAYLSGTHAQGAVFHNSYLEGAVITQAHLMGASFKYCQITGTNFHSSRFGKVTRYSQKSLLDEETKSFFIDNNINTIFELNQFSLSYKFIRNLRSFYDGKYYRKYLSFKRRFKSSWLVICFLESRPEVSDFTNDPELLHYIQRQKMIWNLSRNNRTVYNVWNLTTRCGESFRRLAFISLGIIILFALLYSLPWYAPSSMPTVFSDVFSMKPMLDPKPVHESLPNVAKWFFVSFDIFTNLGVRNTHPQTVLGVLVVFVENIIGYITLALLISIFTTRFVTK